MLLAFWCMLTWRNDEFRRVSRGWVRGVRTHPCSSSWSLLYICIKQHRCGYHHYLQPEICTVVVVLYSDWTIWVLIAKKIVSKLPHFIATKWCKGHIFGILSSPIDSPIISLKCKETHLKFHSTSSSDPSLLFFCTRPSSFKARVLCHITMMLESFKRTKLCQCTSVFTVSFTQAGDASHWWRGQWTTARIRPTLWWSLWWSSSTEVSLRRLRYTVTPNSVNDWYCLRAVQGHVFGGSVNAT